MSKLFGGRWKILDGPPPGQGGQSQVYRAIDTTGEHQGEFALKRVLNPERHDRFRNEVEAIKRLTDTHQTARQRQQLANSLANFDGIEKFGEQEMGPKVGPPTIA